LPGPTENNCSGTIIDDGYNLSSDPTCAFSAPTSLTNTDPLLLPLQNNGGPTATQALCTSPGRPVAACPGKSPALDAIPPGINGCGTAIITDQRGVPRPQGVGCDLGAFEATDVLLPFAAFEAKVTLFRSTPVRSPQSTDACLALGSFTLGTASKGIKPRTEPVVFALADTDGAFFKQTLPPGSFRPFGKGGFLFRAPKGSPGIQSLLLQPSRRAGRFIFLVQGEKLDLRGANHPPVTVSLQIGEDTGAEPLACRKFSQGLFCQ